MPVSGAVTGARLTLLRAYDMGHAFAQAGLAEPRLRAHFHGESAGKSQEFPMLYGIDDWRTMNANDMLTRTMDRIRSRAGVRTLPRTNDVNAFLAAFGVKGRRA